MQWKTWICGLICKGTEDTYGRKIKGNQTLSGTWGEVWINGEKILEMSKIETKVTVNREDVQIGIDVDSKMTGLVGEGTLTVKKVYTRAAEIVANYAKGKDVRGQIITKLADPDAVGGQVERYSIDNVWFTELCWRKLKKVLLLKKSIRLGLRHLIWLIWTLSSSNERSKKHG